MMPASSFTFNGINSIDEWGIKINAYDVFSAPKRNRRTTIPFRDGSYDFGRKYFDDKVLRIECNTSSRSLSKADLREVAYVLLQKGKLYLWDEPDKYYIAELMDSAEVSVSPKYTQQTFALSFVCEPFIYKDVPSIAFGTSFSSVDYRGTIEAPTVITITDGGFDFSIETDAGDFVRVDGNTSSTVVIDSEQYTVMAGDENLLHKHNGIWIRLNRNIKGIRTTAGTGEMLFVERYI